MSWGGKDDDFFDGAILNWGGGRGGPDSNIQKEGEEHYGSVFSGGRASPKVIC